MSGARRWAAFAAFFGAAGFAVVLFAWYWRGVPGHPDFDLLYIAARALREGRSPYGNDVLPAYGWATPLLYPLPALIPIVPLTVLPIRIAGGIFVAITGGLLGTALAKQPYRWRWILFASHSFIICVAAGQWTVLFLAASWLPAINLVGVVKPNVAAIAAARWRRMRDFRPTVLGGLVLLALSFALRPSWLAEWRAALGSAPYEQAPLAYPFGWLALTALVRWRDPDARLLLAYTLIPQTPGPYTTLMLFAIPRSKWEAISLALLSYLAFAVYGFQSLRPTLLERTHLYGEISSLLMLLPCVAMILMRSRPGSELADANLT